MTWPATVSAWGLLALGTLLVIGGLALLYGPRARAAPPLLTRFSTPTRLLLGVLLLIAGYHAAAWAWPPSATPLQLPRQWWWVWVLSSVLLVAFSTVLDRVSGRDPPSFGP